MTNPQSEKMISVCHEAVTTGHHWFVPNDEMWFVGVMCKLRVSIDISCALVSDEEINFKSKVSCMAATKKLSCNGRWLYCQETFRSGFWKHGIAVTTKVFAIPSVALITEKRCDWNCVYVALKSKSKIGTSAELRWLIRQYLDSDWNKIDNWICLPVCQAARASVVV